MNGKNEELNNKVPTKKTANKRINTDNLLRCALQISGYARRYEKKTMKTVIEKIIPDLIDKLGNEWDTAIKADIESADGRKKRDNPICRTGSILYVVYSSKNTILYVGETSKSIKRRFISDGSGSHKKACNWYSKMKEVKFLIFSESELPIMHRKLLEQALSIHYNPKYYRNRK